MASRSAGTLSAPARVAMDHVLLFVTLTLALMGLVMVFSASAIVAGNRFHDPEFFLKRQIAWLGFGVLLMHLTSRIDYQLWKKLSIPILVSMVVLLVMVLVPSLGVAAKGARRWLRWGLISIQPAEMVKLVTVIYLAAYLARKSDKVTWFRNGLLPVLIVVGLLSGLVLLEPDLGEAEQCRGRQVLAIELTRIRELENAARRQDVTRSAKRRGGVPQRFGIDRHRVRLIFVARERYSIVLIPLRINSAKGCRIERARMT